MEEKVKKRGWIKNAAIIFLFVMLVLTFFSNTIMNRSLPEAATQCVTSGTIETKVRGTGTVSAKENYDVIIEQTRKVNSVPVKVGQAVSTGDVLFTLEPGESQELDEARETLYQMQLEYQKSLLANESTDYSKESRDIDKAREALETAKLMLERQKVVTLADQDAAQLEVDHAQTAVDNAQIAVDNAQAAVDKYEEAVQDAQTGIQNTTDPGYSDGEYVSGKNFRGKTRAYYERQLEQATEALEDAKKPLKSANDMKADAEKTLKKKEAKLDETTKGVTAYDAAKEKVRNCEETLSDALFTLEQKKETDGKQQQSTALELQDKQRKIEKQKEKVEELAGDSGNGVTEVKSKVNGNVKSITVSAGRKANAGDVLATIEVPDLGYTMSFTVTNEQARKVRVGDTASVSNYYWGSQIDAELVSIKADPQNPQTSKILTFDVKGDVGDGNQLTLAVGQKSAEYDFVVPNSAIRTDTNGSFVLIVAVKSSPLGNRYTATRVDVQVVASDDTNSAITGALNDNDYVITTSNKPITNGDLVRLPDNL